jgi:type I restriction enzyme, S subunit
MRLRDDNAVGVVPLGSVVTMSGGGTPRRDDPRLFGGDVPWVTPKDMKVFDVNDSSVRLTEEGLRQGSASLIPAGSVLVVVRSGVLKRHFPVAVAGRSVSLNQDMKALSPDTERLDSRYLARFLQARQATVLSWVRGTTADNVPVAKLASMELPLPPLEEQRRIADVLDRADALRATRRETLARLDELALAMIAAATTANKLLPAVTLGELCHVRGGKRLPKGAEYAATPTSHPYIRVTDLRGGRIDEGSIRHIDEETHQAVARYIVEKDDVVISIAGSIGVVAPVPAALVGANLTENAARISPRSAGIYNPRVLARLLSAPELQAQILRATGRVTIGKLALFRIEALKLRLPTLAEQDALDARLELLVRHRRVAEAHVALLDELFASLQQRAFRGDLFSSPLPPELADAVA